MSDEYNYAEGALPESITPMQREEYGRRLNALRALISSEGWRLLEASFSNERERLLSGAEEAKDGYAALRNLGAHRAIRDMLSWPMREAEAMVAALRENK